MFVTILISLYATRLILSALGAEDYGIYVVIGGIIAMLGFLNTTMATSTQRYLSFSMGKNEKEEVKRVFANSLILHLFLSVILVVVFEVFGQYLLAQKLTISPERLEAARLLFHLVVASTFVTIISVPFDGLLNAKENMIVISIISIVDSVLRLAIAYSLLFYANDALILFGFLMLIRAIFIAFLKRAYCRRKYAQECKVHLKTYYRKKTIRELYSFAGWNLIGILAYIFRNQGIAVVLNLFFNTVVIAAYGIANQINTQLRTFSGAMIQAIQPQIVKDESSGDRDRMIRLSILSSRFAFYIFAFIALPLFLQMEFVLQIWLEEVPPNTVIFCKLVLAFTLIQQFRLGITIASHAVGNIKEYQFYTAPMQLLTLPIGYLVLKLGYASYSILWVTLIIEVVTVVLNIVFFKKLTKYKPAEFVKRVIINCLLSLGIVAGGMYVLDIFFLNSLEELPRFLIIVPLTAISYALAVYVVSFNRSEKQKVRLVIGKLVFRK
ncbi:MATE family efflux transporter [Poritiphilus flavus]|uniref:Oligosaccharide flippase family protein n=1 Tax=Poritiphilus flavus TaxID=2697053 RepID=A0A6L9EA30_9FLAO|nr:MATE family efflux transporter [Poritiphilus flavus]NAS11513.1 oligosaccharide flippase family protein [Poritiphilus flavus]